MQPMRTVSMMCGLLAVACQTSAQTESYGANDKAGHYCDVGDAKIYYEVYGEGAPVVLLHGGYAYIDQFKDYIPILSRRYKVIAVATRGYGRSHIGTKPVSYELLAEDVKQVIETEGQEKAIVIGFSDGAIVSYLLAARHPEVTSRIVAMGGPLGVSGYRTTAWMKDFTPEDFRAYRPHLAELMPQPERWNEYIESLLSMWKTPYVLQPEELRDVDLPVLLLFGDRDSSIQHIALIYSSFPNAQLAVFPSSTHIEVSFRKSKNTEILTQYILRFME